MSLQHWWKDGQDGAVAVYPARLLLPLAILTGIVVVCYFTTLPHSRQDYWFFPTYWAACAVPLLVRRRRAAIFTHDTFLYRPVFGHPLGIPLAGIKRAYFFSKGDREGGFVRLELLVGGQLDVRLNVSKPGEIIQRLQKAAQQGS
jgi:hypothetical protein